MNAAHLPDDRDLTPAMRHLLERAYRLRRPGFHDMTPELARATYQVVAETLDLPRAPLVRVEDRLIPVGPGGERRVRLYANGPDVRPVVLFLHGGGFVVGGLETHDSLCRQIALRSGAAVVALDYRLAPEHRFPAAWEDTVGALQWLAGHADQWGLDPTRLAVVGDSAGGTLAAGAALWARDRNLPVKLQGLITPGTTAHADTASHLRYATGYLLERDSVQWFFDHYIDWEDRIDWRFAPLHVSDLDGVAPAWVGLAECDPLVDEGVAYADRLRMAGVPVDLELYRGVTHDFIKLGRQIPEAVQAQDHLAQALRQALEISEPA